MKYSYYNPTAIQFGEGQIKTIVNFISKDQKILLVYGGGSIKKNGVYAQVSNAPDFRKSTTNTHNKL